jgi:uroporphyrinogen decarboxylase
MNSRERVLKTIRHEEPDRVPLDLGGMASTGIMAIAYNKLKQRMGINPGPTRVYDVGQQLAEIDLEILAHFDCDVISMRNSLGRRPEQWRDWTLPDGSVGQMSVHSYPVRQGDEWVLKNGEQVWAHMPEGCLYFEGISHPLAGERTGAAIKKHDWRVFTDAELRLAQENAKYLFENTDLAIMAGFGGNILEIGQGLRGWEDFMLDLAMNDGYTQHLLGKMVENHLENLALFLDALKPYIQIIQMGDDMGTQAAPQVSVDMYRELIKPCHSQIYQYVHAHSDVHVFLHSCGSIYELIPDLIDAGVEILNPVQTSAVNMEPQRLKNEFGDKLTFWGGGLDTQQVLPNGTPEEVAEQVRERMEIFAPGGGFVFTQVHNIQANIPVENIIAEFEAAKKYRNYPF